MKKANLYYHISSKEHLLRMIFAYYFQDLLNFGKSDFPISKSTSVKLEYIWIKRARWAFDNPTPMKFIYYRMALESSNFIKYLDDLLKKTIISGIQTRKLIGYQNHNYLICLFHSAFNSVIISLIGKRYGSNQKIMIVKRAFKIFYEQIERNILEPIDY